MLPYPITQILLRPPPQSIHSYCRMPTRTNPTATIILWTPLITSIATPVISIPLQARDHHPAISLNLRLQYHHSKIPPSTRQSMFPTLLHPVRMRRFALKLCPQAILHFLKQTKNGGTNESDQRASLSINHLRYLKQLLRSQNSLQPRSCNLYFSNLLNWNGPQRKRGLQLLQLSLGPPREPRRVIDTVDSETPRAGFFRAGPTPTRRAVKILHSPPPAQ